ncbi:MAG: putative lipid II flippase FtsW [Bifidobacteriaceae bacterium]|jgi:cell division protein FtsW|nr:putative lipid II flippase FtsW [Bifidobacteriaceae bacterium]
MTAAPTLSPEAATSPLTPKAKRQLLVAHLTILFTVSMLTLLGLIMTVSANTVWALSGNESPYYKGLKQGGFALAGVIVAVILAHLHQRLWQVVAWVALAATFALQVLVILNGIARGGNQNWLKVGPVEVQPSEFIKFALALWLGSVLAKKKDTLTSWVELAVPALFGIAVALGLVMAGRDAGTALVVGMLAVGALVLAGVPWSKLILLAIPALVGAAAVVLQDPRRVSRFLQVLRPESCVDPLADCWQINQAKYALAQGGLFGSGLGASRQKWSYLSQADSDFIYAIIGEEVGLCGALLVLALFGALGFALFQIVRLHPDRFTQVTVGAIGCWLMCQAMVNIGMVIQVLPVIGVPLPFVSAGGSALISSLAAIGVVEGLLRRDPEVALALQPRSKRARQMAGVFAPVPALGGDPA